MQTSLWARLYSGPLSFPPNVPSTWQASARLQVRNLELPASEKWGLAKTSESEPESSRREANSGSRRKEFEDAAWERRAVS